VAETSNSETLLPAVAELASGKNFAAVATVFPSGMIQNQILWVGVRDGKIVLNTETHRKRFRNLSHDPRITVLIRDEQDPGRYAEVRGEVSETITGPEAREHINEQVRAGDPRDQAAPAGRHRPEHRRQRLTTPGPRAAACDVSP
jgi:PPOX class probable F420-dependent enzyme